MNEHRKHRLQLLSRLIESGDYRVDPDAVAEAIIRRVWHLEPETSIALASNVQDVRRARHSDEHLGPALPAATEVLAGAAS
jgi:hypothetical protein